MTARTQIQIPGDFTDLHVVSDIVESKLLQRAGCERLPHGKALCRCHDRAGRYSFAKAQKSPRSPSDLTCSCVSAMFTSVLVRFAGSTWATPVGPDTCLADFQHNLAKQTGRPKTWFVTPRLVTEL